MLEFLAGATATFGLCWIWIGGYVADVVIWLVSKLTPQSSNEKNLAYTVAGIFLVLGLIVAATTSGSAGSTLGGAVAGAGLYIAVRLPGKIRGQRAARAGSVTFESEPEPVVHSRPAVAQAPVVVQPTSLDPMATAAVAPQPVAPAPVATGPDPRADAWAEVHDPSTAPARLAGIAVEHPEFGSAILAHPNLYPGLREWIEQHVVNSPDR